MIQSQEKKLWKKIGNLKTLSYQKQSLLVKNGQFSENCFNFVPGLKQNTLVSEKVIQKTEESPQDNLSQHCQQKDFLKINSNTLFTMNEDAREFSFSAYDYPSLTPSQDQFRGSSVSLAMNSKQKKMPDARVFIKRLWMQIFVMKKELQQLKLSLIEQLKRTQQFYNEAVLLWGKHIQELVNKYEMSKIENQARQKKQLKESLEKKEMKKYVKKLEEQNRELIQKLDETLEKYLKQFEDKEKLKKYNSELQRTLMEIINTSDANHGESIADRDQVFRSQEQKSKPQGRSIKSYQNYLQGMLKKKINDPISKCSTFHSMFTSSDRDSRRIANDFQSSLDAHHKFQKLSRRSKKSLT